jgi:hypothetical protein
MILTRIQVTDNLDRNEISLVGEQLVSRDYGDCQDMLVLLREEVAHHSFRCYRAVISYLTAQVKL